LRNENSDLPADSHNVGIQLLNVHSISGVNLIEIHAAEPLVLGHSPFEIEIDIEKLKEYKSPGSDQIPVELIQAGGETLLSKMHNSLILFGIRKDCLISGRSLLLYQFTKKGNKSDCNNYLVITAINFIQHSSTLKMKVTLLQSVLTTWSYIPEDTTLRNYCFENLKSY
jgi:hypothetical protein